MNPQQFLAAAEDAVTVRRVFGDPIHTNGLTLVPAAAVRGGGGVGSKGGDDAGGGGFGLAARPAGAFAVRDGNVSWHPALDLNRVIMGGQLVAITALLTFRPLVTRWLTRRSAPPAAL